MISNIFGKTKPINFIIVLGFLFIFYWGVQLIVYDRGFAPEELVSQLVVLTVLLFSIFAVDFIIKRNKLTGINSFAILYYALLIVVFPETLLDNDAIFCSLFLLLASRRLISIRSLKNIKEKIFDATLWIVVSSFFYDWAVLYLALVFAAIYIYEPKSFKNWLVPFVAVFTVFMIGYCVLILTGNTDLIAEHYDLRFIFDRAYFLNLVNSTKLVLYILIIVILSIYAFLRLGKAGLGKIVTMRLIALSFAIGLLVKFLTKSADAYPLMITFFPAVVFVTNYVESVKKPKIKELFLIASITIPLVMRIVRLMVE